MHAHGDGQPHEHHGGARAGLAFDLLDSIMLGAFVVACGLLAEILWKAWRERREGVRYDLTPEGRAATSPEYAERGRTTGLDEALKRMDAQPEGQEE